METHINRQGFDQLPLHMARPNGFRVPGQLTQNHRLKTAPSRMLKKD
jgi:hypothetical protein